MTDHEIKKIECYFRAANYISAAQIFLQDNFLLQRPLRFDDIKPRLLGHWGTCPGINFVYAQLQHFVKKYRQSTLFVLGPGHGFPALQANLFIEGTLQKYYPDASQNLAGLGFICKNFSWPYGFPSHVNPGTPGAILEGGELGYALSTSFGSILDNKDLLTVCLVGDGEAETAATATGWHLSKFVDPKKNGFVLPILHLNGYKISGPTLFGRMSNKALKQLFSGYGYEPVIVEGKHIFHKMAAALDHAHKRMQEIRHEPTEFRPWPLIILKTLKGWTGIKRIHGKKIEGTNNAHQVVIKEVKKNKVELKALQKWLESYRFNELFDADQGFCQDITSLLPSPELLIGNNNHAYSGRMYQPLALPDAEEFAEDAEIPGTLGSSSMHRAGLYLKEVVELNQDKRNFRFFSPDEIYSNKLDALLQVTNRAFMLPIKPWDEHLAHDGRVIEMLSEHSLQGLAQGYILTGRHAIFASYESFIEIVSSMTDQYTKFLKQSLQYSWRGDCASLNYILTSSGWRQEHNGFSHQNPSFIGNLIEKNCPFARAYFPPDGNSTLAVLQECLTSKNSINIIVAGKTFEPRWITVAQARTAFVDGLAIWDFASDAHPDIVFSAAGDYLTKEALAAIDLLKRQLPNVKVRFVNIMALSGAGLGCGEKISCGTFEYYFTQDKPVIFNYHGYPQTLKAMLFDQPRNHRFDVRGYIEEGSTTTPFDMQLRNKTSRYHLVMQALQMLAATQVISDAQRDALTALYRQKIEDHCAYIQKYGIDPKEIEEWQWTTTTS